MSRLTLNPEMYVRGTVRAVALRCTIFSTYLVQSTRTVHTRTVMYCNEYSTVEFPLQQRKKWYEYSSTRTSTVRTVRTYSQSCEAVACVHSPHFFRYRTIPTFRRQRPNI